MIDDAIAAEPLRADALRALWTVLEAPTGQAAGPKRRAKAPPAGTLTTSLAYRLVKRGISSRVMEPLGDVLGLGKGLVAEYLDLDRSTAHRKVAQDQPLPTHAAESVLRLLELDEMAHDTFETSPEASAWLRRAHPMLEGETPLQCAKSSYGAQRVKDILLAIKYGGTL